MTFERDLELWEAGRLSEPDLLARHPQDDPAFYVELHRRLTAAAAEPIADDETGWETLRARLPERVTSRQDWVGRWMARPLLAGVAVVALSGVAAFAASPAVRSDVSKAVHAVSRVFGSHDGSDPSVTPAPVSPKPSPVTPSPSASPRTAGHDGGSSSGGGTTSGGGGTTSGGGGTPTGGGSGDTTSGDGSGASGDTIGTGNPSGSPSPSGSGDPGSVSSGDSQGLEQS